MMFQRWFFVRGNSENSWLEFAGPFSDRESASAYSRMRFEETVHQEFGEDHKICYEADNSADYSEDRAFYSCVGDGWSYSDEEYACYGDVYCFDFDLTDEERCAVLEGRV